MADLSGGGPNLNPPWPDRIEPGDFLLLDYGEEEEPLHERVFLRSDRADHAYLLTPDDDVSEEYIGPDVTNRTF